jgi:hypothetical protein
LALGILATAASCSKTICTGVVSCQLQINAVCEKVAGCKAAPACELRSMEMTPKACSTATQEADCVDSKCKWTGMACVERCGMVHDQSACTDLRSPEQDPFGNFLWSCRWSECTGKPDKDCGNYSPDLCPVGFGCKVETTCTSGDCGG